MTTTEAVVDRALRLAAEHEPEELAVRQLLDVARGKRVALVLARQQIDDQADDLGAEVATRATSLIDATIDAGNFAI